MGIIKITASTITEKPAILIKYVPKLTTQNAVRFHPQTINMCKCNPEFNYILAKKILSRPGDYGWCEFNGNGNYPNFIKRNSLSSIFRQRFALGLPFNNQNYNNANDDSDYPVEETKYSY